MRIFLISIGLLIQTVLWSQNFMPFLNMNNAIQKDKSDAYFKEIWLKSKDVNSDNAYGYIERASQKIELGFYKEALEDINRAISIDSTLSKAYTLQGFCMLQQESINSALDCFKKALTLDTAEVVNYLYIGHINYIFKEDVKADSFYRICIVKKPDFIEAYIGQATIAYGNKKFKTAEKLYRHVIDIDPNYYMAYFNLALLYLDIDFDKSLRYFGKTIAIKPDFAPAYYYRGILKIYKYPDSKPTFKDWNKAIEIDSTNWLYRISIGFLYMFDNKYNQAVEEFIHVSKLQKMDDFSSDFVKSPDERRANDFFEQVVVSDRNALNMPSEEKTQINKALCLFYQQRHEKADFIYNNILNKSENKGLVYYLKANNLNYLKSYSKAQECYLNALNEPTYPDQVFLRAADNLMFLQRYNDAITYLNIFINKHDSVKFAFRCRGISYVQIEQFDSALIDFDRFLKLDSTESDIYFNRAMCFKAKQNYVKAIENFDLSLNYTTKETDMESLVLKAECSYTIGDTAASLKVLTQTYDRVNWLSDEGHLLLGQIYLDYKTYDSAIIHFTTYIHLNSKNSSAYMFRGKALYSIGDYQNAKNDFTQVLNINNDDMNAYYARGLCYIKQKDQVNALKDFEYADKLGHPLAKRAIKAFIKDYNLKDSSH